MTAYVICSNDSIEGVVIGNKHKAHQEMHKLSRKGYMEHKNSIKSRKAYNAIAYWHIHEIDVL